MNKEHKRYHSIPLRTHYTQTRTTEEHERLTQAGKRCFASSQNMPVIPDDDEQYLPVRQHTSARRYMDTQGNEVLEQGNKRLVIHRKKSRRGLHWIFFTGSGMLAALLLFVIAQWAIAGIRQHNVDAQYGYPRTWQTDAVVGHNDSSSHPSHFIFENLKGHVVVIEFPGGDIARSIIYSGSTIYSANGDQFPVTGSFEDTNGDGRPDMEIHIDGQTIIFLNNGTKFVAPSQ